MDTHYILEIQGYHPPINATTPQETKTLLGAH